MLLREFLREYSTDFSRDFFSTFNIQISIVLVATLICSVALTGLIRGYVLRNKILDIPNERSSHTIPVPRGGGLSIVVIFTFFSFYLDRQHMIPRSLFFALSGGILIAIIGWLDDLISIRPLLRAAVHAAAAVWAVFWLGGLAHFSGVLSHFLGDFLANFVSYFIVVFGIVWCVNLYNFMDGIDGLAGGEGLFISLAAGLVLGGLGIVGMSSLSFGLAATIAGFLVWNWPPAKIFMGDVASGYLGFVFAVLALATTNLNMLPLGFWCVIAAVFLCDATFTLLYRIYRGERWYEAHREHAYQYLVRRGASHKNVTVGILLVNALILFPATYIIFTHISWSFWILAAVLISFLSVWSLIVFRFR